MDNINNTKEIERYEKELKEIFLELVGDASFNAWSDSFEVESFGDKEVEITYNGTSSVKEFKKACKKALSSAVESLSGEGVKVKIFEKKGYNALSPRAKKNIKAFKFFALGMAFVCIAAAVIIVLFSYIGNRSFRETFYSVGSIKADAPIRVIQLSDMHGVSYGKDNEKLIERVRALSPDVIICTGDIVDSTTEELDFALSLASALSDIAPSYYIYGNNEVETIYGFPLTEKELDEKLSFTDGGRDESALLALPDDFEEKLESVGMKVLKNEMDTIKVGTTTVDIYGVLNSNPSSFWSYSEKAFFGYTLENPDHLKITAVHEPFIFEVFDGNYFGDLLLAGHTHGGLMRVPVLGPLVTNEGGLFPERSGAFVYGRYSSSGSPLIVSAGLENSNILRINNEPELVVIDINKF